MTESSRPSDVFPIASVRPGNNADSIKVTSPNAPACQASAISHFETGTRKPSFDNLRRLADALDVTTDYLLGRVKDFTDSRAPTNCTATTTVCLRMIAM